VMAVFAAGFSLYALILPQLGAAGAAAVVALVAALGVSLFALAMALRARQREREAAIAQAELANALPNSFGLGEFARERPIVTLAVTALGGLLAARHPALARDLLAIVAKFSRPG
jgi:hypothetical protein